MQSADFFFRNFNHCLALCTVIWYDIIVWKFIDGIQKLTQTERDIFGWYLDGLSAADILEKTGTQKSTLKFHNHNILNKLGVSSRKQMLRYAALMKQLGEGGRSE